MTEKDINDIAITLFQGGWKSEDHDKIIEEYGMEPKDADAVCALLHKYEESTKQ